MRTKRGIVARKSARPSPRPRRVPAGNFCDAARRFLFPPSQPGWQFEPRLPCPAVLAVRVTRAIRPGVGRVRSPGRSRAQLPRALMTGVRVHGERSENVKGTHKEHVGERLSPSTPLGALEEEA